MRVIMACGCATGDSGCSLHNSRQPMSPQPELSIRKAYCAQGGHNSIQSHSHLAFFVFRGQNSKYATDVCKNCKYYKVAHNKNNKTACSNFEPIGPAEQDTYYCGCYGWN